MIFIGEKGRFGKLLTPGKKIWELERTYTEQALEEFTMKDNKEEKVISKLQQQIEYFEKQQRQDFFEAQDKLDKLYQLGLIDSAGDPILAKPDDEENNMS